MSSPLEKPEGISWNPAAVDMPEVPMLPPGQDAMSMTISAMLPMLAAPLAASVATLQAKETMFSGKLGSAQAAYENADDSGGQSVGQLTSMLGQMGGQVGQMGQMAGQPAQALSGQTGMFGQMMQKAMSGAQGGGSPQGGAPQGGAPQGGGGPAGGGLAPPPQGSPGAGASPQGPSDNAAGHDQHDQNPPEHQKPDVVDQDRETGPEADRPAPSPVDAAGPSESSPHSIPPPVEAPATSRDDGQDAARTM